MWKSTLKHYHAQKFSVKPQQQNYAKSTFTNAWFLTLRGHFWVILTKWILTVSSPYLSLIFVAALNWSIHISQQFDKKCLNVSQSTLFFWQKLDFYQKTSRVDETFEVVTLENTFLTNFFTYSCINFKFPLKCSRIGSSTTYFQKR